MHALNSHSPAPTLTQMLAWPMGAIWGSCGQNKSGNQQLTLQIIDLLYI